MKTSAEILIVDDNPADIDLVREALARGPRPSRLSCATDGVEAVALLRGEGSSAGLRA